MDRRGEVGLKGTIYWGIEVLSLWCIGRVLFRALINIHSIFVSKSRIFRFDCDELLWIINPNLSYKILNSNCPVLNLFLFIQFIQFICGIVHHAVLVLCLPLEVLMRFFKTN